MGTQAIRHRVVDKLIDAALSVLAFVVLIFILMGLAGDAPFETWGPAIGFALVGIAVLAVVARRRDRREIEARGEPSIEPDNVHIKRPPLSGRLRDNKLELLVLGSVCLLSFTSYMMLWGVSWKIWGSGLAIGAAGFAVGWVLMGRQKKRGEVDANDSDVGEHRE